MGYRIKYDIGTAVSIALAVGTDPNTGSTVEQEVVYLPGAILPSNFSPRLAQAVDDGEEHISKLVEYIDTGDGDGRQAKKDEPLPQQQPQDAPGAPITDYPPSSQPALARQQESSGGLPQPGDGQGVAGADNPFVDDGTPRASDPNAPTTVPGMDYTDMKRADLDAELARRQASGRTIEVTGTGSGGNVVASDIAAALKADDEANAS